VNAYIFIDLEVSWNSKFYISIYLIFREEELYFTFVDIMRSPEMIKAITGSAIKKK